MRVAIVEDEAVVARRLERMVREIAGDAIDSVRHASSLDAALGVVDSKGIDLLFLDLNLDGRNGFRVLERVADAAFETIIVSAHHEQALRAFEYGVLDFVGKPWTEERLRTALERALGRRAAPQRSARFLTVTKGPELRRIPISRIAWIAAADDFAELHLEDGGTLLHTGTLTSLTEALPETFLRIHRSYVVNLERVRGLRGPSVVMESDAALPIGRTFRDVVQRRLGFRP